MKRDLKWIEGADAALKRAAKRALELGIKTNTPVYVMRDGKIVDLTKDVPKPDRVHDKR